MQIAENFQLDDIHSPGTSDRPDPTPHESATATIGRSLDMLRGLSRRELRHLFRTSAAPDLMSIRGEYGAELLNQGGKTAQRLTQAVFGLHGKWLGKAFHPISQTRGVGYNTFEKNGESVAKIPMDTYLSPSTFESGDSMIIRYDGRHFGPIRWLVGELREISPNVLLGMGLYGLNFGSTGRNDRTRRKIPFVLYGPTRPYQLKVEKIDNDATIISGKFKRG